jgi:membrane-associated phospholipid phosphatase
LCINWVLGVASYYWVPSLGPFISNAKAFVDLPNTAVTSLQSALLEGRQSYIQDPHATDSVQSVAAFASLHVSVVFTASLICFFVIRSRAVRITMWVYFVLTVISTIYFGWHYILDDVAGLTIGLLSVWIGGRTTGHPMAKQRYLADAGDGVIGVFPPRSAPSGPGEGALSQSGPDVDHVGGATARGPKGPTKDTASA